ncbi:hypothetical protein [Paraburkholderia caffeinilytica]|uniref:hypothetical protein n=1 Tax=Paraburkholderia caffeinilytica TaxID=1761016 RepID=UPI003DA1C4F8
MSESNLDFLPLKIVSVGVDGKRRFDQHDRFRLIEACLLPSVSVARMAREAGVNANPSCGGGSRATKPGERLVLREAQPSVKAKSICRECAADLSETKVKKAP